MKKLVLIFVFFISTCSSENKNLIIINSIDNMQFDINKINIKINEKITLILKHNGKMNKQIMGHNFVLLNRGTDVNSFAKKAMASKDTEYIPRDIKVLANTRLIGGGETDTISFTIDSPGKYDYICSFPGHYQIMRGELIAK